MQKKLNEDFIDSYCEKFASKVTDSFFSDEKITVSGKEILEITPSKQTNFFVVKLLFRYWQGEIKKLESPFFNYEHENVKDALTEFMNVLSQHIAVHKNGFQMLLNHAVKDTIYLASSPQAYLEIDLEDRRVDTISPAVIDETLKYLKTYKKDIKNFMNDMNGLTIDDVIDELPEEFDEFDSFSGLAKEAKLLSEIHPLDPNMVLVDELPDGFEDEEEEVFDNDDLIQETLEKEQAEKERVEEEQRKEVDEPKDLKWEDENVKAFNEEKVEQPTKEPEPVAEEVKEDFPAESIQADEKEERGEVEEIESPASEEAEDEPVKASPIEGEAKTQSEEPEASISDAEKQSLEDSGFNWVEKEEDEVEQEAEVKTINDQFDPPEKTVADHHQEAKPNSMMELVSVNHQFMFVKELFNDDKISFQNALIELEDYDTFDDAVEFLVQSYAKEFKWNMQSTEVKELLKVLFRKFRG